MTSPAEVALLGTTVAYVRLNEKNEPVEGSGQVYAVYLNEDGRVQLRLKDSGKAVNVDYRAINLSPEERQSYIIQLKAVRTRADAINAQIKEYTTDGNAELQTMYTSFLGEPIVFDEVSA